MRVNNEKQVLDKGRHLERGRKNKNMFSKKEKRKVYVKRELSCERGDIERQKYDMGVGAAIERENEMGRRDHKTHEARRRRVRRAEEGGGEKSRDGEEEEGGNTRRTTRYRQGGRRTHKNVQHTHTHAHTHYYMGRKLREHQVEEVHIVTQETTREKEEMTRQERGRGKGETVTDTKTRIELLIVRARERVRVCVRGARGHPFLRGVCVCDDSVRGRAMLWMARDDMSRRRMGGVMQMRRSPRSSILALERRCRRSRCGG